MRKKSNASVAPIIRIRSMLAGVVILGMVIAGPLLLVWKQVYISSASRQIDTLSDSLRVLTKEVTTLKLRRDRLASSDRIEEIAKNDLGLEYPSSDQIVVIKVPKNSFVLEDDWPKELAAFIKRSLFGVNS